ncbi:MAG: M48 family metallopeptidase [Bacteroidales bacterium]|nr:M48 family metallopeptidase [Bacteroidales bacterium]
MEKTLFIIIVAIIIFEFLLERFLNYLNSRKWSNTLPKELEGIYDPEEYKKSQDYKKDNDKLSFISSAISVTAIILMLFLSGFAFVDEISREITSNTILITLLFFGILMFTSDLIGTPFALYDTFVIEEKYGFNKMTKRTFFLDKIKGWLLTGIIGGGLLALVVYFYMLTKEMFWIYTWLLITVFMIFMNMFYSSLIVPLFNKQTPLEEGDLRNEIEKFCQKVGFKLDNVYVIDGSKRSTKANAYFSGLGPKKRIVLYDTLINDLTKEEIVAVLAHEIGHYKRKHTLWGISISIIQTGLTLYILSLLIENPLLSSALGAKQTSFHLGLITFGILYSPISTLLGLGLNMVSRKNEYEADRYANTYYKGEKLISALKKLSKKSLSNLTPHPLYVFFHYSHPTLLQRIQKIRSNSSEKAR